MKLSAVMFVAVCRIRCHEVEFQQQFDGHASRKPPGSCFKPSGPENNLGIASDSTNTGQPKEK